MIAFLQYLVALHFAGTGDLQIGFVPRPDLGGIAAVVGAYLALSLAAGFLLTRRVAGDADRAIGRILATTTIGRLLGLAAFYVIAQPLGGRALAHAVGVEGWVLIPHLVRLLPFFVMVVALRAGLQPAMRAARVGPESVRGALAVEFRQALMPLAPMLVLLVLFDLLRLVEPTSTIGRRLAAFDELHALQALTLLGVVFLVLLVLPFALRIAWKARPLPVGPLRDRLDAYSRRVGFRARDILVWRTGGDLLNAAVVGAFPRFRYVILTDGLLDSLDDDEVEAVFAHEAGHARRGHILLFFGFTAVLVLVQVMDVLGGTLAPLGPVFQPIALMVIWLGVVFGWVSRRFEQEADVWGVETLPPPTGPGAPPPGALHPFARALDRIGHEVGGIREMTGWRHFSIADRVEFVQRYVTDPAVRRSYQRGILVLRGTLLSVIFGIGALAVARLAAEIRETPPDRQPDMLVALDQALRATDPRARAGGLLVAATMAHEVDRRDDAVRWLREVVALGAGDPGVLSFYAAELEATGRPLGARVAWQRVADDSRAPEQLREFARGKGRSLDTTPPK